MPSMPSSTTALPTLSDPGNRDGHTRRASLGSQYPVLRRELRWYQIFAIAISGTVGMGIFVNTGLILRLAGPGGALFTFAFVGLVAVGVMECIAEMIGIWPVSNPFVEFLTAFVDEDLAIVIGLAYWATYCFGIQTLLITGSQLCDFWGISSMVKVLVVFIVCPIVLYLINYLGVFYFGWVETVAGILKLLLILCAFVLSMALNNGDFQGPRIGTTYLNDGFQAAGEVASSVIPPVLTATVPICFTFTGVELVAITAFEAKNRAQLKKPVKVITWFVAILYFVSAAGFVANVKWCDPALPTLWNMNNYCQGELPHVIRRASQHSNKHTTNSIFILALLQNGSGNWPGIMTGFLIFSVLTTSNTSLYVASRSLFGLTRKIDAKRGGIWRPLAKLGTTYSRTGVPAWALLVSLLSFCWIPFIHLRGSSIDDVINILGTMDSTASTCVWASQCLVYIRFYEWRKAHKNNIRNAFDENHPLRQAEKTEAYFQPAWAWFGLVSCLSIIFLFNSASWWHGHITATDVIAAYLGVGAFTIFKQFPIILFFTYLILKLSRQRRTWYKKLRGWRQLHDVISQLDNMAQENVALGTEEEKDVQVHQPPQKEEAAAASQTEQITSSKTPNGQLPTLLETPRDDDGILAY